MPTKGSAKIALDQARRWGALGLFRLASTILRAAIALYQRGRISKSALRAALAAARSIQRMAAAVLLGLRRPATGHDRNRTDPP